MSTDSATALVLPSSATTSSALDRTRTAAHQPRSLRHNASWTLFGNLVFAGSSWAMLTVLAKLGTPRMVGQYALGLAVTQPIMALAMLHLRSVQATDARGLYRFGDYLGLRLITTALACVGIVGIALLGEDGGETAGVIMVTGLGLAFDAVSDVFYGLFQQHERMDRIAISMAIRGPLSLIGLAAGLWLTGSVLWAAAGSALASALVLAGYDTRGGVRLLNQGATSSRGQVPTAAHPLPQPRSPLRTLAGLTWLTLPMGVTMLLNSLVNNVPRYFIADSLGEGALGIFAATAMLLGAARTLIAALGQAASPRGLARLDAAGDRGGFLGLSTKLVGIGALLGIGAPVVGAIWGRAILTSLYTPEYARQIDVFLWLLAAGGLSHVAALLGVSLTAARRFRIQVPINAAVLVISFLTCWWLIPRLGLRGAALSACIAMGFQAALNLAAFVSLVAADGRPKVDVSIVPESSGTGQWDPC